jgi:hypothetical protein
MYPETPTASPEKLESKLNFAAALIDPESMLSFAIEWMQENLSPNDVFTREQLHAWALTAGFAPPPTEE